MSRISCCRTRARSAFNLLLAVQAAACARVSTELPRGPEPIDTLALRTHTRALAHDSLRGRGTGTPEKRRAAQYIGEQLRTLGLHTLGGGRATAAGDYLDPVPLLRTDVADATLTIGNQTFEHAAGWLVGRFGRSAMQPASGPVVRISGDSSEVPRGAWLLLDASPGEAAVRWVPVWRERGVVGLIVRVVTEESLAGWFHHLGDVRWQLAEGPPDPVWQADLPVLMVGPDIARELVQPGIRAAFDPRSRSERLTDYNVVGVIRGEDPGAAPVFLTAHYDHLGVREAGGGDSIFNGFSDNAAGVSMLLAIAGSATRSPPPRPLIFLFAAAEEVGLLGSIHFTNRHPALVARAHALVNVDAGAPPAAPTRWRLAGGTRSDAGAVAAAVVEAHGWTHRSDGGSPNSDHWPFMMRGVPSIFLIPDGGFEGLSEDQAARLVQRWDRYHRADDEWAADFPFAGLERYATLASAIAYALAEAELPR